jgi:hypothetical protein
MSARFGHLLVRGKLRELGYSIYLPEKERQKVLDKAVKEYGGLSVFRKLIAVYTLNKNRNPTLARKFRRDAEYVKRKYYRTKEWESKMVISQRAREKLAKARALTIKTIKGIKKALRLDPGSKVKMQIRSDYISHQDYKGEGLIRVVRFKEDPKLIPEFAIYLKKNEDIINALMSAKFKQEASDKFVLRTKRYNIFVYFV